MTDYFEKIRDFLLNLEYTIVNEDKDQGIFVIDNEEDGVKNMILAIAPPILIIEQPLFKVKKDDVQLYKTLLKKNRDMIHGAMVLDDEGKTVLYRDTLEIENLDLNELEASINSLSLLLSEFGDEILKFA